MKKALVSLLAVVACAALASHRAGAADAKADGPDLKETMKWIKRYLTEDAGGAYGAVPKADSPSEMTKGMSVEYVFVDKPWASPEEATIDYQVTFEALRGASQYGVSFKLKDLDLDKVGISTAKVGNDTIYRLKLATLSGQKLIARTATKDGQEVTTTLDEVSITFLKETSAKKAYRAFRQGGLLAGATDTQDPFSTDVKVPIIVKSPGDAPPITPPITLPPPDDKAARRTALDGEIATVGDAVSQGEQKLTDLNNNILAAKLALVAADAAYQNAESGSLDEIVAGAAVVVAQGVVDDLNAQKDGVASDLRADRDRYNQLKRERSKLGD